jgi:hypothetical protein
VGGGEEELAITTIYYLKYLVFKNIFQDIQERGIGINTQDKSESQ